VTENFENAHVTAGSHVVVFNTINSAGNAPAFLPGDLIGGFSITPVPGGLAGTGIVVSGTGELPGATKTVGIVAPVNSMEITFDSPTVAVGMNLLHSASIGQLSDGTFNVSIYGSSGLLDSTQVSISGANTYFGVTSNTPITKIDIIDSTSSANVFADNLSFADAVPEPASLSLMLVAPILLGLRRRRAEGA
jgi:hypothetical protein